MEERVDKMDRLYEDVFKAVKRELRDRGSDLTEIDQLLKEFSWFMSPISALRMLLKSRLSVKQFRESLIFLSHRHEQLAKEIASNSTVLDTGSGLGLLAVTLAGKNCVVHGTEISEDNIQIAQRLAKLRRVSERCTFHKVETCRLPFRAKNFDVAVLSWTLHDLEEDDQNLLLSECLRTLKKQGKLLILDQESKLNFQRIKQVLAKYHTKKTKEKTLSTVFDHNNVSRAKLIEHQKVT